MKNHYDHIPINDVHHNPEYIHITSNPYTILLKSARICEAASALQARKG